MPNISEHNIEHQKINLDQKIRAIAKDEAKRIPTSRGGGGGGIEEAPKDNKQYARKDAKWSEVVIPPAEEERDPVWTAEKTNYYTKSQADALYASLTGYNNFNWDTAYGWGNHADAGYALSSALSGYVPLIGNSDITGNLSVSGNLGIGTNDGRSPLRVVASTNSSYGMASFGNTETSGPGGGAGLFGYSDDGAAMANGDRLGYLIFSGAKGTNHTLSNAVGIVGYAIEDWSGTTARSKLSFETVASGSIARGERAYINDTEFNVGSGKFFLDIANTKLGIGTTAPFVSMEIVNGTSGAETEVIQLRSGKTAAGSGSSIRWVNSTSNNSTFGAGELAVIRTNAVSSGDSDMIFRVSPAGTITESFRIKSATSTSSEFIFTANKANTDILMSFAATSNSGAFAWMEDEDYFQFNDDINLNTGEVIKVGGTQVVGARVVDARADDAINSGDATTDGVIDALRDAMIAHGLIAAA